MQEFPSAIEEVYAMPDIGRDDDSQEAQRLLQHQHRERQRRALEGADRRTKQEGCNSVNKLKGQRELHFLTQYSKVHCHHWGSLGCKSPLQLLRKFIMYLCVCGCGPGHVQEFVSIARPHNALHFTSVI